MQSELSRSQFAHDTLKESTAALSQLSEQYSTLDTLLSSSRNLLGTLLKSQKSDTWYLETAFYILVATIIWLIFRRFVYGPAWWLIWLPLKMFYKAWMGVFTAVGLRSSRHGVFTDDAVVGATNIPERPTLIVHSSATEPLGRATGSVRAPSVNVGGGGRGAPPRGTEPAGQGGMVEEVGRIIDDSQQQGSSQEQQQGSGQGEQAARHEPNPKKRMWEEPVEAAKEEQRKKDEL
jgi:protein transport protein SEC20